MKQTLIDTTRRIIQTTEHLPFSVYSAVEEQRILNVPVIKPLLIVVLSGSKKLGTHSNIICPAGQFIFLSNTPTIAMRNIPGDKEYFALLIEFNFSDFDGLEQRTFNADQYFQGPIDQLLEYTLHQFMQWSAHSPPEMWHLRRQEILQVLFHLGFTQVSAIMEPPTLSHKLHTIISAKPSDNLDATTLSAMLTMSESTVRRKLKAEGNSLQAIKDRARLGHGLHLIQTSLDPIGRIAEQCGYTSQSRFTDKFKQCFDITPSELRKTRMLDLGE